MKNLIIAGTMKGGTTALYDFISTHSKVLKGSKKEIHYFSLFYHEGEEWYLNHFDKKENPNAEYIIDASPTYFDMTYSGSIPERIKKFDKDSKVIIIVRDPIARAVSHFKHFQIVNKIKELQELDLNTFFSSDFMNAFARTNNIDEYLNNILSFSFYYRKLLIYKSIINSSNLLVLTNNELLENPKSTMQKVFNFMELDYEDNQIFNEVRHSNKSSITSLNKETYNKLKNFFYSDYEKFCEATNITCYKEKYNESSIENEILVGTNDWLYLFGGTNEVNRYYDEKDFFTIEKCKEWENLLNTRKKRINEKGAVYLHLIAPDKISIYPENLGHELKYFNSHPIKKLFDNCSNILNDFTINPINYFKKIKDNKLLYYKTDSHWNFWGAFCAFQLILSKLELNVNLNEILGAPILKNTLLLDLGEKLEKKVFEEFELHDFIKNAERIYKNELVSINEEKNNQTINYHIGCNVIFKNNSSSSINKKVIIFGDSFSEYRPHLLTGLLAETFKEVHFIWSTSLDYNYIEKNSPDIVISEIAERFMSTIPSDNFNLDLYIKEKLKEIK